MVEIPRKIAIDLDDVLVDFNSKLCEFTNVKYGTELRMEDIYSFNLWEIWGCSREEAIKWVYAFYESERCKVLLPIAGAVETVEYLRQQYELVVVTSRPHSIEVVTREVIERHFPGLFQSIHTLNHFTLDNPAPAMRKAQFCQTIGADTLIDDSFDNLVDCQESGVQGLLFSRPWNQVIAGSTLQKRGIIRVRSWGEIPALLE